MMMKRFLQEMMTMETLLVKYAAGPKGLYLVLLPPAHVHGAVEEAHIEDGGFTYCDFYI